MRQTKRVLLWMVVALAAAQLYRPARTNPSSVPSESFAQSSGAPPATAAILSRACGDCHSNQTVWPWYAKIAPVSWLVARDVSGGRRRMNLSAWSTYDAAGQTRRKQAICRDVRSGEMPPWFYMPLHAGSHLTAQEISALCAVAGE